MSTTNRLGRGTSLCLIGMALACLCATRAQAMTGIRDVRWDQILADTEYGRVPLLAVEFDATLSPLDVCCSTTSFSVAVVHPRGSADPFEHFVCGPLPRGAVAGSAVHVRLGIRARCSTGGQLTFDVGQGPVVSYFHPTLGPQEADLHAYTRHVGTETGEVIRFALIDQEGRPVYDEYSPSFGCDIRFGSDVNGAIGVYFDAAGTVCQGTIPAGTTGKIYIVAHPAGATAGGIAGAEFRFSGLPQAWEAHAVPSPDLLALGNPFEDGVVLGFLCKEPVGGAVVLYEVLVIAHEDVSEVQFQIESRDPPISSVCPVMLKCNNPTFTAYCVEGGSCFVNYSTPTTCERPVPLGIEATSWSVLKQFYR